MGPMAGGTQCSLGYGGTQITQIPGYGRHKTNIALPLPMGRNQKKKEIRMSKEEASYKCQGPPICRVS